MAKTWTNWVGNQSFTATDIVQAQSESDVVNIIKDAANRNLDVRVAGSGHSFTPVVETDGIVIDPVGLTGIKSVDSVKARATIGAATTIKEIGEPLWNAGFGLRNQGDIEAQRIAGAIATGTHGSGTQFGSFSAAMVGCRLATASGDVINIDESTPDLLAAAQVSVGTLGVMTEVTMQVSPRYRLQEDIRHETFEDVMSNYQQRVKENRNFNFFWFPSEESAALYNIELPKGEKATDTCHVKIFNDVTDDVPDSDIEHHRVDRAYKIYTMVYDPNFHELEYFIPLHLANDAIRELREFMLASLPMSIFPMEVRSVGADSAWLSSQYKTDTCVISVSGKPGTDYWDYLKAVDKLLGKYQARVHWGKLHFLTKDQLLERYPKAEDFIKIRRELDPKGMFLNKHLAPLLA